MRIEQRQHNRIDVQWKGRVLKKGHGIAGCVVENISIGGAFVRTTQAFVLHDSVLFEFQVSDETPPRKIICECEIMRVAPEPEGKAVGHGLRFERIKDEDFGYLLKLIAHRYREQSLSQPSSALKSD